MTEPFKRILLTGAAGGLGRQLRARIQPWAKVVRLSDLADLDPAGDGEEVVQCDLADRAAVRQMMEGVDAVLHFGGISVEAPFDAINQANIVGVANLYEAAHKAGVRRVIFASSNHTMGYYRTTDLVDATMPTRPDGMYGISKVFGEQLSRFYWDHFGLETVCIRIGSCFPEPKDKRMLSTYISLDDMVELLRCALFAPRVGHTIAFGVSDNPSQWWDGRHARHLGFVARDSSAPFAHLFPDSAIYPSPDDRATTFQGGGFLRNTPQFRD